MTADAINFVTDNWLALVVFGVAGVGYLIADGLGGSVGKLLSDLVSKLRPYTPEEPPEDEPDESDWDLVCFEALRTLIADAEDEESPTCEKYRKAVHAVGDQFMNRRQCQADG